MTLERHQPLPRHTPLRAKKRIQPLGARGRAKVAAQRKLRDAVFRRDNYRCQVQMSDGCTGRAEHPHHLWPTGQGGPDSLDNEISTCRACHDWIHHRHPAEARRLGFLRDG